MLESFSPSAALIFRRIFSAQCKTPVVGHVDDLESGTPDPAESTGKYKRSTGKGAYLPPPPPPPPPAPHQSALAPPPPYPYPNSGGYSNGAIMTEAPVHSMEMAPLTAGSVESASSGLALASGDAEKSKMTKISHAYLANANTSNESLKRYGSVLMVATLVLFMILQTFHILYQLLNLVHLFKLQLQVLMFLVMQEMTEQLFLLLIQILEMVGHILILGIMEQLILHVLV